VTVAGVFGLDLARGASIHYVPHADDQKDSVRMTSRKKPKKSPARKKAKPKAKPKTKAKPRTMALPKGRPSDYTQEKADLICMMLAEGVSLREICRAEDMPHIATVMRWILAREGFREQYVLAREVQADTLFDETLDIADNAINDWMERRNRDGEVIGWIENGEAIKRSQLRIDTRKWIAGKLHPKKYADRTDNDVRVIDSFVIRAPEQILDDEQWLLKNAPKAIEHK
jgi:hypothetical protein